MNLIVGALKFLQFFLDGDSSLDSVPLILPVCCRSLAESLILALGSDGTMSVEKASEATWNHCSAMNLPRKR